MLKILSGRSRSRSGYVLEIERKPHQDVSQAIIQIPYIPEEDPSVKVKKTR